MIYYIFIGICVNFHYNFEGDLKMINKLKGKIASRLILTNGLKSGAIKKIMTIKDLGVKYIIYEYDHKKFRDSDSGIILNMHIPQSVSLMDINAILIDKSVMHKLSKQEFDFVIHHEIGHIKYFTKYGKAYKQLPDVMFELKADYYACARMKLSHDEYCTIQYKILTIIESFSVYSSFVQIRKNMETKLSVYDIFYTKHQEMIL